MPPEVDKAAELMTLQTTQIFRNAAEDVLVAELLDRPRPVFELPPQEDKADNLEELFLDPVTQPNEVRDGVDKVMAATTPTQTMDGPCLPTSF